MTCWLFLGKEIIKNIMCVMKRLCYIRGMKSTYLLMIIQGVFCMLYCNKYSDGDYLDCNRNLNCLS